MPRRPIPILLTALLLAAACVERPVPAGPGPDSVPPAATTATGTDRPWWREAVFYEIFVRSYSDSDGDGVGDFNGLTGKLDYLESLGVTGIWLMPVQPSPSYHGYDVTDYYAVNPEYGTMDDFRRFLDEAQSRGMHVIIDLVLNHTSSLHPFFQEALSGPGSPYRDWYIWSDQDQGSGWHAADSGYYFGFFCECMPDLNYRNPAVTEEMQNVVRFWLEAVGVDGFRLDAAKHLIEDGDALENTPATHAWYRDFYTAYKSVDPEAYAVGEVYGAGALMVKSYTGDQLDQVFNFEMASGFVNSAAGGSNSGVNSAIAFSIQDMPDFNSATFLTNHDQNRVMSVLNGEVDQAKVAASLLLTSPGTPFIYYGEEIGMQGKKPDEDIRLPMQWSGADFAGFTQGQPWRAPHVSYPEVNVARQDDHPGSLLNHYRALIRLRAAQPALRSAGIQLLKTGDPAVYASLRSHEDDLLLVIVNLSGEAIADYGLGLGQAVLTDGAYAAEILFDGGPAAGPAARRIEGPTAIDGVFEAYRPFAELPPYRTYIIRLSIQN